MELPAFAASDNASQACPRPRAGSLVNTPPDLRSTQGKLELTMSFRGGEGPDGLARYCYVDGNGSLAPTLRLHPGDELILTLKNDLRPLETASASHHHTATSHSTTGAASACSARELTAASTNLHFHGLNVPPTCHQDEVIHTLLQPSDTGFEYRLKIPRSQSPGLYWYHPHPHGYSEAQVLGGASGALIVEGIERVRPDLQGLPERVLVLRDQVIPGRKADADDAGSAAGKNISLNFVPVLLPLGLPAALAVHPSQRELWRVLNASADTYFDLQLLYRLRGERESSAQPLELVGMDGAPIRKVRAEKSADLLLPPGGRAEFLVTTPPEGAFAQMVTRGYDTGPDGEKHPYRAIANIVSRTDAPAAGSALPRSSGRVANHDLELSTAVPVRRRKLYFSEDRQDLKDPSKPAQYFITVDGAAPHVFDMNFTKPDIAVRQGTVEDWTIENRAREAHVFHIHQLHFLLLERDGRKVTEPVLRDTVDLPYWDGKNPRYPSIKLRMDFRNPEIVGTFLYHCHILEHEDAGMMGSIQVLPK
jgi:FtsP/CotA-like multicopper oxidase with cupredoxin domain